MNAIRLSILPAALLALSACGGSSAEAPAPQALQEVPAAAYASAASFSGFARQLPASEDTEPLELAPTVPPTSETDEPEEGS